MAQSGISLSNDPAINSMVDNQLQGDVQVLKRSLSLWKTGSKIVFVWRKLHAQFCICFWSEHKNSWMQTEPGAR